MKKNNLANIFDNYEKSSFSSVNKIIISAVLGILSLFFSQYGISVNAGLINIDIPWSIMLPALVTLSFGIRYGLISGIMGGAIYPFLLWSNNGWTNVLSSSLLFLYIITLNIIFKIISSNLNSKKYLLSFITIVSYFTILYFSYISLFPKLLSLNPPFWINNTIKELPISLIESFVIKDVINLTFITFVSEILLRSPFIRKLFGLQINSRMRNNGKILIYNSVVAIIIWIALYAINASVFSSGAKLFDPKELFSLFIILFSAMLAARVQIGYLEIRLEVEDDLRSSESRLKIIYDNTPDTIMQINSKGIITYINRTVPGLDINSVLGSSVFNWIPNDFYEIVAKAISVVFEEGLPYEYESIGPGATDGFSHYHVRISPVKVGDIVDSAVYITTDITEQKKAQFELQQSLNRNQALLDANPDMMFIFSETGEILDYHSPNLDDLYVSPEKFLNKNIRDVMPVEFGISLISRINRVKNTGETEIFNYSLNINGTKYFESRLVPCGENECVAIVRNITDRIISEQAIRTNEKRFRSLFEQPILGCGIVNPDFEWIDFNDKLCEIVGYTRDELKTITWLNLTPLEELNEELQLLNRFKNNELNSSFETDKRYVKKSGELIDVHISAICVFNDQGEQEYWAFFVEDISFRKQNEEKLKESEKSYISLFDSMSEAIYIQTPNGIFVDVNEGALKMYEGYTKEDFIGRNPDFVSAPGMNDLESVSQIINEVFETGAPRTFEFWGLKKTGVAFPKELIANKGVYFGQEVIIITARDITERKVAEAKLLESEERYRAISENSHAAICIVNEMGRITWCNEKMIEIGGYSKELIFAQDSFLSFITEESKPFVYSNFLKFVKREEYVKQYSFDIIRADGEIRKCEKHMMHFENAKGERNLIISMNDVTENWKSEEIIKAHQIFIKNVTENTPDIIYIFSLHENRNTYLNRSISELLGYGPEELSDNAPDFFERVIHPDDLKQFDNFAEKTKHWTGDYIFSFEYRMKMKTGEWRWFKGSEKEFRRENGEIVSFIGSVQDITGKKQGEMINRIRYNIANAVVSCKNINELYYIIQNELNTTLDARNFFIAFYNAETGKLNANIDRDEMDEILSWTAKGSLTGYLIDTGKSLLLRKSDINRLHEDGLVVPVGTIPEAWLGAPLKIEGKCLGAIVMQNYQNENTYNDTDIEIIDWVAHELSMYIEMKNAEENSIKLTKAMIQSPTGIIITDIHGNIEYVNPKFTELSGFTPEEAIGQNPRIIKSGKQNVETYKNLWETILSGKEWRGELQNQKKNGELYWEDVSISPIFNEQGIITHFVSVKEDITERKNLMQELIEAKERAEESDVLKSAFLANMSHEIRTPMNAILGFSHLLDAEDITEDEKKEYIHFINKRGNDLLKIINDILDISKIEANQLNLFYSQCDINSVLDEIHAIHSISDEFSERKEVKLIIGKRPPEQISSFTDYARLQQILNNLVGNALKFTEKGYVEFGCSLQNEYLEFYVKDTGIGIPEHKLQIIFERFRQAEDNHLNRKFEGTGLGLSICKGLIDLMNGEIKVESESEKGSTFIFKIPYIPFKNEIKKTEKIKRINYNWLGKTILIVEDDKPNAMLLEKYLKNTGAKTIIAYDGISGIYSFQNNSDINLVLMDVQLPDMNGYQVTKQILELSPDMTIIAQTAHAFEEDKRKAMESGCKGYIAKPVNRELLLELIDRFFE